MADALDDLDRRLIAALRHDGRAPVSKLAELLKVSRITVQTRIDKLIDKGTILGFTVQVSQGREDGSVRAIMMIEISGRSANAIVKRLRGFPELCALHTTNGRWDLIAEIRAADLGAFDRVLNEVRMVEGVLNSETSIMLSSY